MEMLTPALKIWRNAVVTSESSSQLSMCLFMLYDCVAWEKSIMKVVSWWCGSDMNYEYGDDHDEKARTFNPLTPRSDQYINYPYNFNTVKQTSDWNYENCQLLIGDIAWI